MLYICYIFIYLIVEKDAIAFFQNITKDELLLSEKEKSSLCVCVCVWLFGGPCDEFLRVGSQGLNPIRNMIIQTSSFLLSVYWSNWTQTQSKAGPLDCIFFLFFPNMYAGARSKARAGFESRSNMKKWCWNPSVISSSCWRSVFIADYI